MESNINWENVGNSPDQLKYLDCSGDISESPHMKIGGGGIHKQMPLKEMEDNEVVRLVINLVAVKNEMDRRIEE